MSYWPKGDGRQVQAIISANEPKLPFAPNKDCIGVIPEIKNTVAAFFNRPLPVLKTYRRFFRIWAIGLGGGFLIITAGMWLGITEISDSGAGDTLRAPTYAEKVDFSKRALIIVSVCAIVFFTTFARSNVDRQTSNDT